ncbi:hypothetical protein L195_g020263 [Trifolium pratense]|uniref:Uncharacterized protein n=1 Tax=Trifolium pratense TaxID=57577 RepID=A0A2K3N209_TRIPR|nr:hypothetical protein L195_g020263 [Trifolium pratense]
MMCVESSGSYWKLGLVCVNLGSTLEAFKQKRRSLGFDFLLEGLSPLLQVIVLFKTLACDREEEEVVNNGGVAKWEGQGLVDFVISLGLLLIGYIPGLPDASAFGFDICLWYARISIGIRAGAVGVSPKSQSVLIESSFVS